MSGDIFWEALLADSGHAQPKWFQLDRVSWEFQPYEISAYPLLVFPQGSTTRGLLEAAFRQAGLPLHVAMNLGSVEVIKRFVEIGLGVSIVPRIAIADEVRSGRLAAVPIRALPAREIGLVEHKSKRRSAAATAFLDLLSAHVQQQGLDTLGWWPDELEGCRLTTLAIAQEVGRTVSVCGNPTLSPTAQELVLGGLQLCLSLPCQAWYDGQLRKIQPGSGKIRIARQAERRQTLG